MDQQMTYDVVIIGGGLAGLTLARQLLMEERSYRILLLDKAAELPGPRQKVGESTIQIGGWYYGKTLDMEEYLQTRHYMKYNLRYYWRTNGTAGDVHEHYSQSFIKGFSNIPCYQLDRNEFEREVLARNLQSPHFTLKTKVSNIEFSLGETAEQHHVVAYSVEGNDGTSAHKVTCRWVVDAASRSRVLGRLQKNLEPSPIRHGSSWFWLEGLVDVQKLTKLSHADRIRHPSRSHLGHSPEWLATNHFMGEGLWFWVIPLQGLTSLGLVFDHEFTKPTDVLSTDKLLKWVDQRFPLFSDDFKKRKLLDAALLRDYSHGVKTAISPARWAITGEAGRFLDPLYSTGSDFIALHNTFITAAILSEQRESHDQFVRRVTMYEQAMRALYESYFHTYDTSYRVLGDQEAFSMKYTWELSLYFTMYVLPFINGHFTDPEFIRDFLPRFARVGAMSAEVLHSIGAMYDRKKQLAATGSQLGQKDQVRYIDFMLSEHLRRAERCFYAIGVDGKTCLRHMDEGVENLNELAIVLRRHADGRPHASQKYWGDA